ncbi:MAG TPA: hotdog domain-containing protein [Bryobacteraceae bacterium]|jgi:fluoroacetyl-CoA thioesterase|nr:hotdog domain-containing protein [Bryobacteraceae bacterium]
MAEFKVHAKREETVEVGNDNAINFLGPEGPRVLGTPHMIGYMERVCRNLVFEMLDEGFDTVGTHVNVSHCAAARMGAIVTFEAELLAVNERRVEFRVAARTAEKLIGEGQHQRAIIDVRRFKQKVHATR